MGDEHRHQDTAGPAAARPVALLPAPVEARGRGAGDGGRERGRQALVGDLVRQLNREPARFLRTAEVALVCGVPERVVAGWVADGKLSFVRTPSGELRCPAADVVARCLLGAP